ncbi:MAG: hypothetical protein M5R40_02665 [Anaerolineae bacterium]|nr:hypothetical protein [Anaerolineae bacterium]
MADLGREAEEVLPDWVDDLGGEARPDQGPAPFAADWMSEPTDDGEIERRLPETDATDLDWMQDFATAEGDFFESPAEETPGRVPTGLTDEFGEMEEEPPDWFRELTAAGEEAAPGGRARRAGGHVRGRSARLADRRRLPAPAR